MKRSVYEAPVTDRFQIELEGGFCSGSATVRNPEQGENSKISDHTVNANFNAFDDKFYTDTDNTNWE